MGCSSVNRQRSLPSYKTWQRQQTRPDTGLKRQPIQRMTDDAGADLQGKASRLGDHLAEHRAQSHNHALVQQGEPSPERAVALGDLQEDWEQEENGKGGYRDQDRERFLGVYIWTQQAGLVLLAGSLPSR